jgi:hypothetical protein
MYSNCHVSENIECEYAHNSFEESPTADVKVHLVSAVVGHDVDRCQESPAVCVSYGQLVK